MKFNILYLHETAKFSGAEESLLNLIRFLDREKFTPFFILPEPGQFAKKLQEADIKVFVIPLPKIRGILGVWPCAKKLFKIARENNIHLLHTNSTRTHMYGIYVARKLKIPIIWHERNVLVHERIDLDRLFSFLPDTIICNSLAIANRFLADKNLPEKVKIIYNGVDTQRFNPTVDPKPIREEFNIRPDEVLIGIGSRFNPIKGHETFFLAAATLLQDKILITPQLRFLVIGGAVFDKDKRREKYLKDLVRELNISESVTFAGVRDDMPQIYAAMDIFVLPSLTEGCGRVILEAMASGKPVVATNTGGTPEIVKDKISGFLIKPRKPALMAERISWLVNNPERAKKMGEEGRKLAQEKFRIETNVAKIEEVYKELCF